MLAHRSTSSRARLSALALPLLLALPPAVAAQVVRGVVSDVESRAPVAGAMVLLLAAGDRPLARVLTAEDGRFLLSAPTVGRFRLRVDRIGYASVVTDPFEVGAGEAVVRDVATGIEPVVLEGIDVEGARRCQVRPAEGLATARVWEEARKALAAAAWTAEREMYRFAWTRFVREVSPDGRKVLDERRTVGRSYTPQPFVAVPAAQLAAEGFVGERGGDHIYYAPDANVLLSDDFLDTHCLALEGGHAPEGLIGLHFEPVKGRRLPEVKGVVWLERVGARLQSVDYGYVNLGRDLEGEDASGEIRFEELPNGTWIVQEWRIRMPRVEERRGGPFGSAPRYGVLGYRDEGGEVRRIVTASGEVVQEARGGAVVSGEVRDSLGAPVAGARVWLAGTDREARSGADGTFALQDVAPGSWRVGASVPALDAVGHPGTFRDVEVGGDPVGGVRLELPSVGGTVLARCDAQPARGQGVVFGFVVDDAGAPVAGASVHATWTEIKRPSPTLIRMNDQGLGTVSDARGAFFACGVPTPWPVTVTATWNGRTSGDREVRFGDDEAMVGVRIALSPAKPTPGDATASAGSPARTSSAPPPDDARAPDADARWLAEKGFPLRTPGALLHQTGAEVRHRGLPSIARILEQVPRIEVRRFASGAHEFRLHEADDWKRRGAGDSWCTLDLYLNGSLARQGAGEPGLTPDRILDLRLPDLMAVEVFDAEDAPVAAGEGCGAALLWFRRMAAQDLDFEGRISGRILLPGGAPASDVVVTLSPGGAEFRTDERGRFDFGRLPPARYRIEATLPGWGTWTTAVPLRAGDDRDVTIRVEVRDAGR